MGADVSVYAAALVVMLEQALLAANHLLDVLDGAAKHSAEATQLGAQLRMPTPGPPPDAPTGSYGGSPAVPHRPAHGLSCREAQVLDLLAAGRNNHQIAHILCLSPRTVQRHIANAYLKIGAHNKADATAYALGHRLT